MTPATLDALRTALDRTGREPHARSHPRSCSPRTESPPCRSSAPASRLSRSWASATSARSTSSPASSWPASSSRRCSTWCSRSEEQTQPSGHRAGTIAAGHGGRGHPRHRQEHVRHVAAGLRLQGHRPRRRRVAREVPRRGRAARRPDVVCLSGLIMAAFESMKATVSLLRSQEEQLGYRPPDRPRGRDHRRPGVPVRRSRFVEHGRHGRRPHLPEPGRPRQTG